MARFLSAARLLPALLIALLLLVPAALASDGTAKQFLQSIYAHYTGPEATGLAWRGPKAGQYFDPTLAKLIAKDIRESKGEVGRLGADPFIDAQSFDITSVQIAIVHEEATRAEAVASFRNGPERTTIKYALVKTPRGWRIANITWPSQDEDLVTVLSGPLASD